MPTVVMYASPLCGYCRRAKALLDQKGVQYTYLNVDNDPRLWDEMVKRSQRHTVPQIFIDDFHVGGSDDLAALEQSGKLDELLHKS